MQRANPNFYYLLAALKENCSFALQQL